MLYNVQYPPLAMKLSSIDTNFISNFETPLDCFINNPPQTTFLYSPLLNMSSHKRKCSSTDTN